MAISLSIIRYFSIAPKAIEFSFPRIFFSTCPSQAAEKILTHLQKNQFKNVEKNLNSVKANLDGLCISQVLKRSKVLLCNVRVCLDSVIAHILILTLQKASRGC